ncbi:MAG: hypothetical protein ACRDWD_16775 [Acidimicrobiia bacterium]
MQNDGSSLPEAQETQRLKRYVRALSVMNRQLQAQLESGTVGVVGGSGSRGSDDLLASPGVELRRAPLRIRRVPEGTSWLEQLRIHGSPAAPSLVRAPKRGVYLVEGTVRRRLNSGLLFASLRDKLGAVRAVTDAEIDGMSEGPPVEVLEGATGAPFIVVGGTRLPIRGLPLPHPVSNEDMLLFPQGEELDVTTPAKSSPTGMARGRELVAQDGLVRGTAKFIRSAAGRFRRRINRQTS